MNRRKRKKFKKGEFEYHPPVLVKIELTKQDGSLVAKQTWTCGNYRGRYKIKLPKGFTLCNLIPTGSKVSDSEI